MTIPPPIDSLSIEEFLREQDDFALELFVRKTCIEAGFQVSYGGTYIDPISAKARQFDIRGSIEISHTRIHICVECKALKLSYPLVVSTIPRQASESYVEVVSPRREDDSYINSPNGPQRSDVIVARGGTLYPHGIQVGKAIVQIGRKPSGDFQSGSAEVYDKWAQALSSMQELISVGSTPPKFRHAYPHVSAFLPILVIR